MPSLSLRFLRAASRCNRLEEEEDGEGLGDGGVAPPGEDSEVDRSFSFRTPQFFFAVRPDCSFTSVLFA